MSYSDQRSKDWFNERKGRFTGSRISDLMGITGLNKTGEKYAFDMAVQSLIDDSDDDKIMTKDMQRGIDLEPLAFKKFKELKEAEFLEVENCGFFKYGENGGASPDGLVSDDAVLEIKCPRKSTFFDIVLNGKIDQKYYDQMQMEMLATGRSKAYFFNYFVQDGVELWHEIVIKKDEERQNLIKDRIEEAAILRDNIIKTINKNKQF